MTRMCCLGFILLVINAVVLPANEDGSEPASDEGASALGASAPARSDPSENTTMQNIVPRFRGRAVVLEISARIVEQNEEVEEQVVIWNESHRKPTITGQPVGIRLVGENLVVAAQFTPYIRRHEQKILVAQGQVWMDIPDEGISYHSSMQTIPLEFGEPIYFFPLGPQQNDDSSSIEVMLILHPYEEDQ